MKKYLLFLILLFPVLAYGQDIRIQQMRSTGEPAGRLIVTDGGGSFQYADNEYSSDKSTIDEHIDNDNDMNPTNELIDSMRVDSVFLRIYEGGNTVGDSVNLDELLSWKSKIDSINMVGDTLRIYQGGDTLSYDVIIDFTNYWSKTEITEADTARWGDTGTDDQMAGEVPYSNLVSGLAATDAQAAIDEIDASLDTVIASGGADDWGNQVVVSDETLTGPGITGDPLKVDTTKIATIPWVNSQGFLTTEIDGDITNELITAVSYANDTLSITEAGTTHKVQITAGESGGITELTGEVTASGTGSVPAMVSDNVIDYGNVDETLKSSTTNNTLAWDISANGIIYCAPSSGTVSFSNYQVNKSITVVLTLSGGATISWPSSAKIIDGSATLEDGTFYVYIHCISSSIFTVSITKEAS